LHGERYPDKRDQPQNRYTSARLDGTDRPVGYEGVIVEPVADRAGADIGVRLNRGDPEALEDCYRTLGPLVVSYLARYVPYNDVEDVLQRVFYELWRVHERYDPNQSLRAWVLGIARKRAIDHLRKRRDVVVPIDSMREIVGDDGREVAERLVWADEVRSALDQLPDPQRKVIELAYFDQYTQSEIAVALEVPLGTVKTRTARGLQRMAGLLESTRGHRS
jgi:RNA polymerase sigma factor (sigma-70 family)